MSTTHRMRLDSVIVLLFNKYACVGSVKYDESNNFEQK